MKEKNFLSAHNNQRMLKKSLISIIRRTRLELWSLFLLFSLASHAQTSFSVSEVHVNEFITGTLLFPEEIENPDLVLLIQGSGPTDRDGNQPFLRNDALKKLARALGQEGIASFRFDKRITAMQRLSIT